MAIFKTAELVLGDAGSSFDELKKLTDQLTEEAADHDLAHEDILIILALDDDGDVTGVKATWSL